MADVVEFLTARLAEDEAAALESNPDCEPETWRVERDNGIRDVDVYTSGGRPVCERAQGAAGHIARHDPARVLREVTAKRAILAEILSWEHAYVDGDSWLSCAQATSPSWGGDSEDAEPGSGCADEDRAGGPCDCGLDRRRATMLHVLAAPYATSPDYNPAWSLT